MITKFKLYENSNMRNFFIQEDGYPKENNYIITGYIGFKNHIIVFSSSKDMTDSDDYIEVEFEDEEYEGFNANIMDDYEEEIIDYIKMNLYGNSSEEKPDADFIKEYKYKYDLNKELNNFNI